MPKSLYMVIEKFKNGDPLPIYRRFHQRGRLAPDGLVYVASWVDQRLNQCFQVMETDNRALVDEWISHWKDLVDFEVVPVYTSAEASERVAHLQS